MSSRRERLGLAAALLLAAGLAPRAHAAPEPLAAALRTDGWVTYRVPLVAGEQGPCCFGDWQRGGKPERRACKLERWGGRNGMYGTVDGKRSQASALALFLKVDGGAVRELLAVGDDCPVEAGDAKVRTVEGVTPEASAALLLRTAGSRSEDLAEEALQALALHDRVGVEALLGVARDASRSNAARRQALFWLASSEDPRALAELEAILTR